MFRSEQNRLAVKEDITGGSFQEHCVSTRTLYKNSETKLEQEKSSL